MSSSASNSRSSRDVRNKLREEKQIAAAIELSREEHEDMQKKNACDSLAALRSKVAPPSPWHAASENNSLIIFSFGNCAANQAPNMDYLVVINEDLLLNVYIKSVKIPKINDYSLPMTINSVQTVHNILDAIQSLDATPSIASSKAKVVFHLHCCLFCPCWSHINIKWKITAMQYGLYMNNCL